MKANLNKVLNFRSGSPRLYRTEQNQPTLIKNNTTGILPIIEEELGQIEKEKPI